MGLFGNQFKDGPGVNKNAPKKKGIALFADILANRFSVLRNANILYVLAGLPIFAVYLLLIAPQYTDLLLGLEWNADNAKIKLFVDFIIAGVTYNFFGAGPVSAAYAYICRTVTRGEHVWIIQDFFGKYKENFKNGILLVIIDMLILFIAGYALKFYSVNMTAMNTLLCCVITVWLGIYAMSHTFAYQIMVTYECNVAGIIKNSLIFTLAKLPMCILLGFVCGAVCILLFDFLGVIGWILFVVFGMIFTRYPLEFYAARMIERYIEKNGK